MHVYKNWMLNTLAFNYGMFATVTTATEDGDKASMLNKYFSECFNMAQPSLLKNDRVNFEVNGECPVDFMCTEEEVYNMLISLDTTKANGPDRISAKMLKETATSITPSLT